MGATQDQCSLQADNLLAYTHHFLSRKVSLFQFSPKCSYNLQNWSLVSPPYKPPCYPPASPPPPGVYSDTGKLAEVWEKCCRSLRPDGREVFKMTFPQLMPDTFTRGKKKNANEYGRVGLRGLRDRGLDFNQGHPATAIRAPHTSLLSYTQLPSFRAYRDFSSKN